MLGDLLIDKQGVHVEIPRRSRLEPDRASRKGLFFCFMGEMYVCKEGEEALFSRHGGLMRRDFFFFQVMFSTSD